MNTNLDMHSVEINLLKKKENFFKPWLSGRVMDIRLIIFSVSTGMFPSKCIDPLNCQFALLFSFRLTDTWLLWEEPITAEWY